MNSYLFSNDAPLTEEQLMQKATSLTGRLDPESLKAKIIAVHKACFVENLEYPAADDRQDRVIDCVVEGMSAANHLAMHYGVKMDGVYQLPKMILLLADAGKPEPEELGKLEPEWAREFGVRVPVSVQKPRAKQKTAAEIFISKCNNPHSDVFYKVTGLRESDLGAVFECRGKQWKIVGASFQGKIRCERQDNQQVVGFPSANFAGDYLNRRQ